MRFENSSQPVIILQIHIHETDASNACNPVISNYCQATLDTSHPQVQTVLNHLSNSERRKLLRYRKHDDFLRGLASAISTRVLWGTASLLFNPASPSTEPCVLCAGATFRDTHSRPRWVKQCHHASNISANGTSPHPTPLSSPTHGVAGCVCGVDVNASHHGSWVLAAMHPCAAIGTLRCKYLTLYMNTILTTL